MEGSIMEKPDFLIKNGSDYYSSLEIDCFANMLKDPSSCYKFFWLEAIVNLVNQNISKTTIGEIINEMISNAWYSVVEHHIHLSGFVKGEVVDGLERAVAHLSQLSSLPSSASKSEIMEALKIHERELREEKTQLSYMVPYRALSGFFYKHNARVNWENKTQLIEYIRYFNNSVRLPYIFGDGSSINREVIFDHEWIRMINDNAVEILGWIQYEKMKWLQNNNPEVPGLVYKLKPGENVRKMERVRDLWNGIIKYSEIQDVYTKKAIDPNNYELDHFVPWSFVMNDELWNLIPMDSSLNSAKSNNLPLWGSFFGGFANNQFIMYELIHQKNDIFVLFEKCYKDNLHSIWASQELYQRGNSKEEFIRILSNNMRPVYDSALRQGYKLWQFET